MKTLPHRLRSCSLLILVLGGFLTLTARVGARDLQWLGTSSVNDYWSTRDNWVNQAAPGVGDTLHFDVAPRSTVTVNFQYTIDAIDFRTNFFNDSTSFTTTITPGDAITMYGARITNSSGKSSSLLIRAPSP